MAKLQIYLHWRHTHEVRQVTPQLANPLQHAIASYMPHKNYPLNVAPEVAPMLYSYRLYLSLRSWQTDQNLHEMTKYSYVANHAR